MVFDFLLLIAAENAIISTEYLRRCFMKRILSVFLAVLTCVSLAGCSQIKEIYNFLYEDDSQKGEALIGFSNGTLFDDSEETYFPASDFTEVKSEYAKYRSDLYFNALSPEEQNIYIALEYAMENNYKNLLFSYSVADSTETLIKVINHLSLDSPLLEQNLRYVVGDFTTPVEDKLLGVVPTFSEFKGCYITVHNFNKEMWDKKLLAIEEAEKRVAALPNGLTQAEKAEELYLSLAKNVEYSLYEEDDGETSVFPYLYDALITEKTQCDGHANALNLLYRLAGINSCEKDYTAEKEGEPGHTWVTFELDGKWYNADSTSSDMIPKKACSMKSGYYFAFSDEMRLYTENYDDVTPYCEQSLYMQPDSVVQDLNDDSFSNAAINAFNKKSPKWALITVHNYNESLLSDQLQKIADTAFTTVYWFTIDLANGDTAVLVFTRGLF